MSKSWGKFIEEEEAELASRRNLMIVDGTNLGFRFKHNNSKKPFASSYVSTIQSLAKSYSARTTIVLGDKGKSVFRLEHLPDYKGNRDEKYAQRTEEEKALDEQFFEYLRDAFELCETTFPTFTIRGVEADDMAAYIVKLIGHLYDHVWLISTDGDWDTLLTNRVSRFSFTTRREYHLRDMYEHHNVDDVDQFISLKAIMGDLGDNIRGVEGIGAKRGYNIIREFGNVLDIIDQLPLPGKQKYIQNLNASEELLFRNLILVDLPTYCVDAVAAVGQDVLDKFTKDILEIAGQ